MRWLLKSLICLSLLASPALAVTNPQSGLAAVTATVINRGRPDTPVLISPGNNSTINTTAPTFIFNPSLGDVPVTNYQLWIDGEKNTDSIPQSFSTITANALTALGEGTHTWMVKALGNNDSERDSAIWTFTIDTTAPLILVNQVAGQAANLSSLDLSPWQTGVEFTTTDRFPLITGQSEAQAFLTISFNNETVSTQIGADRLFSLQPKTSLALGRYSVTITSSDPAGNTTTLPAFYLNIIQTAAGIITIPLPSLLPDLQFTVPVFIPLTLAPVTAFPLIPAAAPGLNYLIWLIIITYLCHIYCLNRFIHRLYLHHTIKNYHFIFIYITIMVPSLGLSFLTLSVKHWLPAILALFSWFCLIFEIKLIRSKHIIIEQE